MEGHFCPIRDNHCPMACMTRDTPELSVRARRMSLDAVSVSLHNNTRRMLGLMTSKF